MAEFYVKKVSERRMKLGKRQTDLIRESGLSAATVRKIEKGEPVGETSARAAFRVLNEWHDKILPDSDVFVLRNEKEENGTKET